MFYRVSHRYHYVAIEYIFLASWENKINAPFHATKTCTGAKLRTMHNLSRNIKIELAHFLTKNYIVHYVGYLFPQVLPISPGDISLRIYLNTPWLL